MLPAIFNPYLRPELPAIFNFYPRPELPDIFNLNLETSARRKFREIRNVFLLLLACPSRH